MGSLSQSGRKRRRRVLKRLKRLNFFFHLVMGGGQPWASPNGYTPQLAPAHCSQTLPHTYLTCLAEFSNYAELCIFEYRECLFRGSALCRRRTLSKGNSQQVKFQSRKTEDSYANSYIDIVSGLAIYLMYSFELFYIALWYVLDCFDLFGVWTLHDDLFEVWVNSNNEWIQLNQRTQSYPLINSN